MPRHSVVDRSRITFSMIIFLEIAPVEAAYSASSWISAKSGGPARPHVSCDRGTTRHAPRCTSPTSTGFWLRQTPWFMCVPGLCCLLRELHTDVSKPYTKPARHCSCLNALCIQARGGGKRWSWSVCAGWFAPVRPCWPYFIASLGSADAPIPQAAAPTAEDASGCVTCVMGVSRTCLPPLAAPGGTRGS